MDQFEDERREQAQRDEQRDSTGAQNDRGAARSQDEERLENAKHAGEKRDGEEEGAFEKQRRIQSAEIDAANEAHHGGMTQRDGKKLEGSEIPAKDVPGHEFHEDANTHAKQGEKD